MYNINIPGIPDLSNLDLSQFNLPQPAPVPAPVPEPEPALAPVPVFDPAQFNPYAGMTQADMAEIGAMLPPQQVQQNVAPVPTPEPAAVPTPEVGLAPVPVFDPSQFVMPQPVPQPSMPTGIETMAPNFAMTEDFMLPADQQALMPATAPVAQTPQPTPEPTQSIPPAGIVAGQYSTPNVNNQVGEDYTEGMVTDVPDVSAVAQGLINPGPITLPNGETFDIRDLDLSGLDLTGLGGQGVATQPAQDQTPAQSSTFMDVANLPNEYITAASNFYTDGQLANMGIEPGTAVSTGANPQQPAGTQIELTPEQQAAIDNFVANNPAGSVIQTPFGNVSLPDLSQYTGGGGSPSTNVDAARYVIQNLVPQASDTARGGSVATTFGSPIPIPQQDTRANPFRRPTEEGIGSLSRPPET